MDGADFFALFWPKPRMRRRKETGSVEDDGPVAMDKDAVLQMQPESARQRLPLTNPPFRRRSAAESRWEIRTTSLVDNGPLIQLSGVT